MGGNNEGQNRPEGTQAGAQSQERGEDQSQAALVPEGDHGAGGAVEPGRTEGSVAASATLRTGSIGQYHAIDWENPSPTIHVANNDIITVTDPVTGETFRYRRPPRGQGTMPKNPEPHHHKNPHERFCDLEAQCKSLRYELIALRDELNAVVHHIQDRGDRYNRPANEQAYYEQQRQAMIYPPTMADYYQNGTGRVR